MRGYLPSSLACALLLAPAALLCATLARADGSFPEPRQILLKADRPEQIILGTNFGLILSEDGGKSWLFSCEQELNAYAGSYWLGAPPSYRLFAMTGTGLVYSDDDSCAWDTARGSWSGVTPYALATDPSNSQRVYAIGMRREDLHPSESIYVSDDGGLTFGEPVFTAPARSALLTVLVTPSRPSRLLATMFTTPENHPMLVRSADSGETWEVAADLVESLGENPFELLAIDPSNEQRLYARILGPSAETLAISDDGGSSFVQSLSIPGKLRAFLQLASGTILVGGTAGNDGIGYRSRDGAQTFEPWPEAPHVHALAERSGKLYVAGENFWDGYALAESDDEGTTLRPLTGFNQVRGVKSCVAKQCAKSCAYHAGINLWPEAVCGAEASPRDADNPADAGQDAEVGGNDAQGQPVTGASAGAERPAAAETAHRPELIGSGGGCACSLVGRRRARGWPVLLLLGAALVARRRARRPAMSLA